MSTIKVPLNDVVRWLDDYLNIQQISDWPEALNGLQLENPGYVTRVAAAVDACESVISQATFWKCDLLLVHHGLFWSGQKPIIRQNYRKFRTAINSGLAIYSAHLPLDIHPEIGNNHLLANAIGMPENRLPFLELRGVQVGLVANWEISLRNLLARIEEVLGRLPHLAPGGPPTTSRVGICTGAAGAEVAAAANKGIDTFITGEGPHWSYTLAEELGINLIYAGHYLTETFGVRALADALRKQFGLPWEFIDHPTGI
ncbi:MAG: Nif3-like dinuclear metal center hexameric protein [Chthoniobacterales bacterium]|nr:Nif3-like dinuclear metal center hexameric protein [Chthoniobacterales bacterium]MCX7713099.1 Nif3-like dinuclear metal center hexameric protein [Chthoniobacterales bacterium]